MFSVVEVQKVLSNGQLWSKAQAGCGYLVRGRRTRGWKVFARGRPLTPALSPEYRGEGGRKLTRTESRSDSGTYGEAFGALVAGVVDEGAGGDGGHAFGREGDERDFVAGEPAVVVGGVEDDRHAVVDGGGEGVGFGDDDRAGLERRGGGVLFVVPGFPQAGDGEGLAAVDFVAGRQSLLAHFLPFDVAIGEDQAAALFVGRAKGRGGANSLGAGVEGGVLQLPRFGPGGNQRPMELGELPPALDHANSEDVGRRRDVEMGQPLLQRIFAGSTRAELGFELFHEDGEGRPQRNSSTHVAIIASFRAVIQNAECSSHFREAIDR
jgi:hypothetical protein